MGLRFSSEDLRKEEQKIRDELSDIQIAIDQAKENGTDTEEKITLTESEERIMQDIIGKVEACLNGIIERRRESRLISAMLEKIRIIQKMSSDLGFKKTMEQLQAIVTAIKAEMDMACVQYVYGSPSTLRDLFRW